MKEKGCVYILTNPCFRYIKIGCSSRPVDTRAKELDNTAVPRRFEIFATLKTAKYKEVERLIHRAIDNLTRRRIRANREFFNVEPQRALKLFEDLADILDDAEITRGSAAGGASDDAEEAQCERSVSSSPTGRRERFKFSMVNIKVGEELIFDPAQLFVKVASDDEVEYRGRRYKLSPFVREFMPKGKRNSSGAYQGSKYFTYKGKFLYDLRTRKDDRANARRKR